MACRPLWAARAGAGAAAARGSRAFSAGQGRLCGLIYELVASSADVRAGDDCRNGGRMGVTHCSLNQLPVIPAGKARKPAGNITQREVLKQWEVQSTAL